MAGVALGSGFLSLKGYFWCLRRLDGSLWQPKKRFELMTVQFDPEPSCAYVTCGSAEQALNALQVPETADGFVRVSILEGNVSWGGFELWCSGLRARTPILEHQDHEARDPKNTAGPDEIVAFKDEDGSSFPVPSRNTVPRDLATIALWE